jgi:hypothetical protein
VLPIRRTDVAPPLAERASVYRWSRQKLGSGAPAPGPFLRDRKNRSPDVRAPGLPRPGRDTCCPTPGRSNLTVETMFDR